jgi:hypothetical protein
MSDQWAHLHTLTQHADQASQILADVLQERRRRAVSRADDPSQPAGPGDVSPFADIVVLRQKFAAVDEYVRAWQKVGGWFGHEIDLAAALAGPDAAGFLSRMKKALERADEPRPSALVLQDDLDAVTRAIGPAFEEAKQALLAALAAAWRWAEALAGADPGNPELRDALVSALLLGVSYADTCLQPAVELREQLLVRLETGPGLWATPNATPPSAEEPPPPRYHFQLKGHFWEVRFADEHGRFRDCKGMGYIARIIARINSPLEALVVYGVRSDAAGAPSSPQEETDNRGLAEYAERYRDLKEEIAEAESNNDLATVKKLKEELAALAEQLNGNRGRRGGRRLGRPSNAQRAADAVRRARDRAYENMRKDMPKLVAHFESSIKLEGTTFAYYPPAPVPPWDL